MLRSIWDKTIKARSIDFFQVILKNPSVVRPGETNRYDQSRFVLVSCALSLGELVQRCREGNGINVLRSHILLLYAASLLRRISILGI